MTDTQRLGHKPDAPSDPHRPRWPSVIGTVGVVLAILMMFDKFDDLAMLNWAEADWSRLVGSDLGALIYGALPPRAWRLVESLVQIGLGVMLFAGALALRDRRMKGIATCRLWAWLAIGWVLVSVTVGLLLVQERMWDIPGISAVGWKAAAAFGVVVALGILLAFPAFLLFWFSRDDVKAEYASWNT